MKGTVTDTLSPKERSERMSRIQNKDTNPEIIVRRLVHGMGFRYRLHRKDLPGQPDLTLPRWRAVIFVHGCFWHRHENCKLARLPKSKLNFWEAKLEKNRQRDKNNQDKLSQMGWRVLVIWECQLKEPRQVAKTIREFLMEAE